MEVTVVFGHDVMSLLTSSSPRHPSPATATATTIWTDGDDSVGWLVERALERFYILGENFTKKLGQHVGAFLHDVQLDLNSQIKKSLANDDEVMLQFFTMPKPAQQKITLTADHVPTVPKDGFQEKKVIYMDGDSLKCEELMELGFGKVAIQVSKEALVKVQNARSFVEDEILAKNRVTYGINTGFGRFASTVVCKDDLSLLQYNLITSTAAGVGSPLSLERTRRIMALRINVLTKGFSGISVRVLRQFIDAFNASCLSWVPEKGTVGASGDLAPLAHLAIGMMGQGKMWSPGTDYGDADKILKFHGLSPIKLVAKEGLALINGTQLITALGVEALIRAENICKQADVVASMSLEALKGTTRAFDPDVHRVRPHPGQSMVAARMRSLLHSDRYPSEVSESHKFCDKVQDAYTLRCIPQVHGVVNDTIKFVRGILETEINSATDNPLILAERGDVISGGNFHGEYPAKSLDYLAIAIHEIANMSERRIERLNNPNYSGLPAFLTNNGGLNSGFMIAHCTAAALVSENKTLCHPASVDSLSTSAGTEDHVSMGGWAARKALRVVENVEDVVGVELLCACQGLEFHRPLKTTEPLEALHELVRTKIKPWDKDRFLAPDMNNASALLRSLKVWQTVRAYIKNEEDEEGEGDCEMENNKKRLVNGS